MKFFQTVGLFAFFAAAVAARALPEADALAGPQPVNAAQLKERMHGQYIPH